MTAEAQIELMQPQVKECQQTPEAGRARDGLSPRPSRESMALSTP